jgi:hypothetical protein
LPVAVRRRSRSSCLRNRSHPLCFWILAFPRTILIPRASLFSASPKRRTSNPVITQVIAQSFLRQNPQPASDCSSCVRWHGGCRPNHCGPRRFWSKPRTWFHVAMLCRPSPNVKQLVSRRMGQLAAAKNVGILFGRTVGLESALKLQPDAQPNGQPLQANRQPGNITPIGAALVLCRQVKRGVVGSSESLASYILFFFFIQHVLHQSLVLCGAPDVRYLSQYKQCSHSDQHSVRRTGYQYHVHFSVRYSEPTYTWSCPCHHPRCVLKSQLE